MLRYDSVPYDFLDRRDVLFAMADPRAVDTEARQPGARQHPRNVHGVVPDRILLREKTLYRVQCRVPCGRDSDML